MKVIVWILLLSSQCFVAFSQAKLDDEFELVSTAFKEKLKVAIPPLIDAQNGDADDSKEYRLLKASQEEVYLQKADFLVEDFKKEMLNEKSKGTEYTRQEMYDLLARGFKYEFIGLSAEFYSDIRKTLKL